MASRYTFSASRDSGKLWISEENHGVRPTESRKPRLLDQVRIACRQKHFSHGTKKSYVYWVRQFILFNSKRHPGEIGTQQIEDYLNQLAAQMSAMKKSELMLPEPTSVSYWPKEDNLLRVTTIHI